MKFLAGPDAEKTNDLPVVQKDADQLVAEGIAAMERGDEIEQEELFAKYG